MCFKSFLMFVGKPTLCMKHRGKNFRTEKQLSLCNSTPNVLALSQRRHFPSNQRQSVPSLPKCALATAPVCAFHAALGAATPMPASVFAIAPLQPPRSRRQGRPTHKLWPAKAGYDSSQSLTPASFPSHRKPTNHSSFFSTGAPAAAAVGLLTRPRRLPRRPRPARTLGQAPTAREAEAARKEPAQVAVASGAMKPVGNLPAAAGVAPRAAGRG